MSNLLQDFRYAFRVLRANPRFSTIAVMALMLGIGANSAIFSVVKSVLLEPLRFPEPERLVRIFETNAKEGRERTWVAPANFVDWRRQIRAFGGIAAIGAQRLTLTGAGEPMQLLTMAVTADFFPILQAQPLLGRFFVSEEYTAPGSQALGVISRPKLEGTTDGGVVILGYGLWRQRFGASASVIGETISVNGRQAMIVGVLPPDFAFTEIPGWGTADCWIPQSYYEGEQPRSRQLSVLARLRPGISLTDAQTELDLVSQRLEDVRPAANRGWGARIVPLHDTIVGDIRRELLVLFGAVGFVLLIACTNTANLLLARAAGRQREIAVRTAVGASRGRLIQQLLTEGVVLSLFAATGGFVLAHWGVQALVGLAPAGLPRLDEIRVDAGVLFFTVGLALVTGVGCGLAPALRGLGVDLVAGLKESSRSSQGATRSWLGRALVVAEIALTLVLLIGAGLMARTFVRLYRLDLGFEPKNVLSIGLNPDAKHYGTREATISLCQAVADRVSTVPGVIAAGVGEVPLLGFPLKTQLRLERSSEGIPCDVDAPTPDYFPALGLRLIEGRLFDTADRADTVPVAIVNRTAARRLWPGDDAVGKRISMEDPVRGRWLTVIGVIEDARRSSLEAEAQVGVYMPLAQSRMFFPGNLLVRTATNPNQLLPAIREAIRSVDRDQPLTRIATMEERLASALAPRRFNLVLMGSFSALAFVLGALGIYGVMSYTVSLRTHEFGIRVALGADPGQVLAMVLGQGLALVAAGEALGLVAAWLLHRVVASMVYGVTTTDPVTFGSAALVWAAVALAACYVPARRATKVDPVVALRNE